MRPWVGIKLVKFYIVGIPYNVGSALCRCLLNINQKGTSTRSMDNKVISEEVIVTLLSIISY